MTSIVGVPSETKADEHRIAITPDGVRELISRGATVLVEAGAGLDSAIADAEFEAAGARLVSNAAEVWGTADLIVKVKEPQPDEYAFLRADGGCPVGC